MTKKVPRFLDLIFYSLNQTFHNQTIEIWIYTLCRTLQGQTRYLFLSISFLSCHTKSSWWIIMRLVFLGPESSVLRCRSAWSATWWLCVRACTMAECLATPAAHSSGGTLWVEIFLLARLGGAAPSPRSQGNSARHADIGSAAGGRGYVITDDRCLMTDD